MIKDKILPLIPGVNLYYFFKEFKEVKAEASSVWKTLAVANVVLLLIAAFFEYFALAKGVGVIILATVAVVDFFHLPIFYYWCFFKNLKV